MKRIFLSLGFRDRIDKAIMKDINKAEELIILNV